MSRAVSWLDRRWYPESREHWDDWIFRDHVLPHLWADAEVLDLGAGAGILPQMDFRGHARRIAGVDPDARVMKNPHLTEARVGVGESIPYPDENFDVVLADNVLEHLGEPVAVFREVARVLRPGGLFLAKTPNRRHYVPLVARLTPHSFHEWFMRKRNRDAEDTFPTRYRANSRRDIELAATRAGLRVRELQYFEGRPEYMRVSALTYAAGFAYERTVNAMRALEAFRVLLVVTLEKPKSGETQ